MYRKATCQYLLLHHFLDRLDSGYLVVSAVLYRIHSQSTWRLRTPVVIPARGRGLAGTRALFLVILVLVLRATL